METLPVPLPRTLTVLVASASPEGILAPLLADLAQRGPLTILDGGNRMPVHRLLAFLRLRLADPVPAARGVTIRRAFTCHQVSALLEAVPLQPHPVVLLDPLSTFYDENVPLLEAGRLLTACLLQVERLRRQAGLLALVPPPKHAERRPFFDRFCAAAGSLFILQDEPPAVTQPALF